MLTITRSAGLPTGHLGLLAGGGGTGASADLDAAVQRGAELLRAFYKQDVVIRFNSDRLSGGAFLKTHEIDGFGRNSDIGLNASLRVVATLRRLYERWADPDDTFEDRLRADGIDPENPPESYLTFSILVKPVRLRANVRTNVDAPYLSENVASPEAGIERLAVVTIKHPRRRE